MKTLRSITTNPRFRSPFFRVFAAVFIPAIVCSFLITIWSPKIYSSTARIEVQNFNYIPPSSNSTTPLKDAPDPYFMTTQVKIIESYYVLTNVITELHLNKVLPQQLDQQPWSMDDTYSYLVKMVNIERTRETSLIEIKVKNISPVLAANIANKIAYWYREVRLEQWQQMHYGGIYSYQTNLASHEAQLTEMQNKLDKLRADLGVPESTSQESNGETAESRMLLMWAEHEVVTRSEYLDYSNILFKLNKIPKDKFAEKLPTIYYGTITNTELTEKSIQLSEAKETMKGVEDKYAKLNPQYQTASEHLAKAQQEYDGQITAFIAGIQARVDQASNYLQIIVKNEEEIKTRKDQQEAKFWPYYRLKDEVDNLRYNNRESQRYLNQEIAEAAQPEGGIVIVRDPGRPERHPISPNRQTFLMWTLGGTLLALVAGGLAAWIRMIFRTTLPSPNQASG